MLLLAVTLFGFGIMFFSHMFGSVKKVSLSLDQDTERQINVMLSGSSRIAIPVTTKNAGRGSVVYFGLGIINIMPPAETTGYFNVSVFPVVRNPPNFHFQTKDKFTLHNNEKKAIPVVIAVPKNAPSGNYAFDIFVCRAFNKIPEKCDSTINNKALYDGTRHRIYINVR